MHAKSCITRAKYNLTRRVDPLKPRPALWRKVLGSNAHLTKTSSSPFEVTVHEEKLSRKDLPSRKPISPS